MMDWLAQPADWGRRATRRALFEVARRCDRWAARLEGRPILSRTERALLERNRSLAGRFEGARGFVLGNGPSLNRHDLSRLAGERFFVSNGFWRHPLLRELQPVGLALCDPAYFTGASKWDAEFAGMRANIREGLFFVPRVGRTAIEARGLLPLERTHFCEFYGSMARLERFDLDLTRPLPNCQTVTLFSILIALYLGCNPIYLVGMDHDFLVTPKQGTHFYQDEREPASDDCYEDWPYDRLMEATLAMWKGYRHLKAVAERHGKAILNASEGGFLDVFPRVPFDSLFAPPPAGGQPGTPV